ncbi:MAG TPA: CapA family protein, partial [Spirochaetota bacterium]
LSFTGDIMMHYAVKGCAKRHAPQGKDQYTVEGFSYLFAKVSPLISSADFAVGNMEFPVSPPFIQNEFIFNCPPEVIPALVAAGFDAVSIANNHLLDQGNRGFFDTIGFLEKYKLPYFGAARDEATARKGLLVEKNGIRVRILSYTGLMNYAVPKNGPFAINLLEEREKLMQDIAAARKDCDILIVQPHWGVEYTLTPTEEQRALYRAMIDAGADLVIGHHPHVLQYIEGVKSSDGRSCAIFYSLGNFICNQNYTFPVAGSPEKLDIRDTIAVILSLTKEGSTVGWSAKIEPLFTVHDIRSGKGGSYKDIRTIVLNDEIAALRKNLVAKPKEKDATQKLIDFYLRRTAVIRKVIFKKGDVPGVTYQEQ